MYTKYAQYKRLRPAPIHMSNVFNKDAIFEKLSPNFCGQICQHFGLKDLVTLIIFHIWCYRVLLSLPDWNHILPETIFLIHKLYQC